MIIAGADPGLDGAIAFFDSEAGRLLGIVDMPTAKKATGRRELLMRVLAVEVAGTLDGRKCRLIVIERQQPFARGPEGVRGMGAASAFALGECYASVKMLAAALAWPTTIVTAQAWKKSFGLPREKEAALAEAGRRMPEDAMLWAIKRGVRTKATAIGRCEAALIALYAAAIIDCLTVHESLSAPINRDYVARFLKDARATLDYIEKRSAPR